MFFAVLLLLLCLTTSPCLGQDCTSKTVTRVAVPTVGDGVTAAGPDKGKIVGPYTFKCGAVKNSNNVQKFDFVVPTTGMYAVDTTESESCSRYSDTVIEVRMNGCNGKVLGCNDDAVKRNVCSKVQFSAAAGDVVTVLVAMYRGTVALKPFMLKFNFLGATVTLSPTMAPSRQPTKLPTRYPTRKQRATATPSTAVTFETQVTVAPSVDPAAPTWTPTNFLSVAPTKVPSVAPTKVPSVAPTKVPSVAPTKAPSAVPTKTPTTNPTKAPSPAPTKVPTRAPTATPTVASSSSVNDPATRFNINFEFLSTIPDIQKEAFFRARDKWESVITADFLSTVSIPAGQAFCNMPASDTRRDIDDILIVVDIRYIDGNGGVLGQAGPCGFSNGKIRVAFMQFDSFDVTGLVNANQFNGVILHEMGHCLGSGLYGTLVTPEEQGAPFYWLGAYANEALLYLGGSGPGIVVEDSGGAGTRRSHWDEATYQDELMTGYLSGSSQPMSRFTVAAMIDIGYKGVNLDAADPFTIPNVRRRLRKNNDNSIYTRMGDDLYKGPVHDMDLGKPKRGREREFDEEIRENRQRKHKLNGRG